MFFGFKYINKLPSMYEQRLLQRSLLEKIVGNQNNKLEFLIVGIGDGEELNYLISNQNTSKKINNIYCVDLLDAYFNPHLLPNINKILKKIVFLKENVLKIEKYFRNVKFDLIQCGFFMHEIEYKDKDRVLKLLNNLLKIKGFLICSDIDADNIVRNDRVEDNKRKRNISTLYNTFIAEAKECFKNKIMNQEEFNLLCGNGSNNGLLFSKKRAINGLDDYYEPLKTLRNRIDRCGFTCEEISKNSKNRSLFVICARKLGKQ